MKNKKNKYYHFAVPDDLHRFFLDKNNRQNYCRKNYKTFRQLLIDYLVDLKKNNEIEKNIK